MIASAVPPDGEIVASAFWMDCVLALSARVLLIVVAKLASLPSAAASSLRVSRVAGELLTRAARRIVDWLERHFGVSYATA